MSACTCNRKFLDAEDFRDHLPCEGTVEQQLRRERDALAAKLDAVWSSLADDIGMTEDDDETEVRKEIKRLHDLVSHLTDLTVGMEAERDEARMLMRDAQIQAEDRGRSFAAAIARAEQAERNLAARPALTADEWRVVEKALRAYRSDYETGEQDQDIETASRIIDKLAKEKL